MTTRIELDNVLAQVRPIRRLPGVTGTVVASMDGRSVLNDLDEASPGSAAAITASSLGLAARLGDLTDGDSRLLELQVRSNGGYVCLYVINPSYLLGVVTTHAVNLARLKLEVRDVLAVLDSALPDQTRPDQTRPVPGGRNRASTGQ
jgi:predicted regulator of Ras-like GTPase activity (Roadblock/LC7/MglB family)